MLASFEFYLFDHIIFYNSVWACPKSMLFGALSLGRKHLVNVVTRTTRNGTIQRRFLSKEIGSEPLPKMDNRLAGPRGAGI